LENNFNNFPDNHLNDRDSFHVHECCYNVNIKIIVSQITGPAVTGSTSPVTIRPCKVSAVFVLPRFVVTALLTWIHLASLKSDLAPKMTCSANYWQPISTIKSII